MIRKDLHLLEHRLCDLTKRYIFWQTELHKFNEGNDKRTPEEFAFDLHQGLMKLHWPSLNIACDAERAVPGLWQFHFRNPGITRLPNQFNSRFKKNLRLKLLLGGSSTRPPIGIIE